MVLLVTVALGGSVLVTAQLLTARVDELVNERLTHAAQSFRTFAESPSGRSHDSLDALFTRYLEDTLPNRAETSFSILDGQPHRRSPGEPPVRLDRDRGFIAQISGANQPRAGMRQTAAGTVEYAVIPARVANDPHRGALVVVEFRDQIADPLFDSLRIFAVVGLAAVVIAGIASWYVAGRVLEPVRLVRQTAERISESDLRRRIPVTGHDDVAALSATFNRMLDRIETAFAGQRQFIDDAGHELRTPITVVRGHLELLGNDPDERRETMDLVSDELNRMSRMVEDLLLLAKTEQPDFVIDGRIELAELTVDVLAKARMLGPRRWMVDELAEGHVVADGQRLTQALMQLATNSVGHTGEGDVVAVGSRADGERLLLWVRDTGSGVDPADAETIFERFQRGSGVPRTAGAGLGLAIVASIAAAHGGTVRLDSEPGNGATFTLDMPLMPADDGPDPDGPDDAVPGDGVGRAGSDGEGQYNEERT